MYVYTVVIELGMCIKRWELQKITKHVQQKIGGIENWTSGVGEQWN
jgi:hypothetical protein